MTAKRKPRDYRIPRWTRLLDPLDFEITSPLPIDTAADQLYAAFDGDKGRKWYDVEYKTFQGQVVNNETLRIGLNIQRGNKSNQTELRSIGFLSDTGDKTRFKGITYIAPSTVLSTILFMIPFGGVFIFLMTGFLFIFIGRIDGNLQGFFPVLGMFAWFFWLLIGPWRAYHRLRLEFVDTLKHILTDDRKTK